MRRIDYRADAQRWLYTAALEPMAMIHEALLRMTLTMQRIANGVIGDAEVDAEIQERQARRASVAVHGGVAVVPIHGPIEQKHSWAMDFFGGTSTERLQADVSEALALGAKGIVFDVNSPGGSVYGVDEAAGAIFSARGQAKTVGVANPMAASAAFYLITQTDEVIVQGSGEIGSLGVYSMHLDHSKMLEEIGIKPTFIHAGEFKVEGNWWEPLSDEGREFEQKRVNGYYDAFVSAVARGRGVTTEKVEADFGQGRMFGGKEAVRRGMADRVGGLSDAVGRATARRKRSAEIEDYRRRLALG